MEDTIHVRGGGHKPRWLRDLERFLPLKRQFVLSGNVHDLQAVDFQGSTIPAYLVPVLERTLRSKSYEAVLLYDPLTGFQSSATAPEHCNADIAFMGEVGLRGSDGVAPGGTTLLQNTLKKVVSQNKTRAALLIDFASRLSMRHDYLSDDEHKLFTEAVVLSHRAAPRPGPDGIAFFNTLIWIVDKETDIPDWLLIENPMIRHIPVAKPDHHARRAIAPALLQSMPGTTNLDETELSDALNRLVEETEGLLLDLFF